MNRVVIGAGSNIRPRENLEAARRALAEAHTLLAVSRFEVTAPIGPPGQPDYLNCAFFIETPLDREALKRWLRELETRQGRQRGADRYAPRTLDLDIIVWNGEIVDADFYSRDFLRRAVLEAAPELAANIAIREDAPPSR